MGSSTNDTAQSQIEHSEAIAWCIIFGLEALVVLCVNLVTIIVFLGNNSLQKHTSILLPNLAIADVLVGTVPITGWVYFMGASYRLWKDEASIAMKITYSSFDIATAFASVTNHGCIAVERLVATLWPFKYKHNKRKLNIYLVAVSWFCAFLIPALTQVGAHVVKSQMFAFFVWMPFLAWLLITIAISYSILLLRTRLITRELHQDSVDRRSQSRSQRFTITAIIITVVSLATWLPFMIMSAVNLVIPLNQNMKVVNPVKFLHFLNSIVNPFIYIFRIPRFKEVAFQMVFRWRGSREQVRMVNLKTSSSPPPALDTHL